MPGSASRSSSTQEASCASTRGALFSASVIRRASFFGMLLLPNMR